jgi:hypothetical protein
MGFLVREGVRIRDLREEEMIDLSLEEILTGAVVVAFVGLFLGE